MLVHIKWASHLEGIYCHETDSVLQLRQRIVSAPSIPSEHKQLVHRGLLLQDDMTLGGAGLADDSTVHIVPNEQPFKGKAMYVKTCSGATRSIPVNEHFRIEDLKEEVYCYPR